MKRARGILKIIPFLALAVAITLAVLYMMVIRMPDPQTASGRGLGRWLVQRDLSGEPEDTQRALVERLLIALRNGEWWPVPPRSRKGSKNPWGNLMLEVCLGQSGDGRISPERAMPSAWSAPSA